MFERNLIKNPCGDQGFAYWFVIPNDPVSDMENEEYEFFQVERSFISKLKGKTFQETNDLKELYGITIETDENGSKHIKDEDGKIFKKFATTHYMCTKGQLIDLEAEGINKNIISEDKPKIEVSDFYSARFDCGAKYHADVQLLDSEFFILYHSTYEDQLPEGNCEWKKFHCVIESISSETRYILFVHGGKDTKYWAGNYGVKLSNTKVMLKKSNSENNFNLTNVLVNKISN